MPTMEAEAREKLLDTALDVARRYTDFGSYGASVKACRALQRRVPGFMLEQYTEAFQQALCLLDVAHEIVGKHKEILLANQQTPERVDAGAIDREIQLRCPFFSLAVCRSAWGWIFMWRYLR